MKDLLPQFDRPIINYLQKCAVAHWQLTVAVYHKELWTMVSEMVDQIDCTSHPAFTGWV